MTILLVEDNAAHAELVKRSLEDHRIANRIYQVRDGETALDYLLRRGGYSDPEASPRPHVVLLDLRLPGMDGLEVTRVIKSTDEIKQIPVVILTSSAAEPDVTGAYEQHANSYLVKPLDYDKFKEMMDDLGFYWLGWNQPPWQ